jgi:DnaJ-class molecular chaperone
MFDTIFGQGGRTKQRAAPSSRGRARPQSYAVDDPDPQDIRVDFLVAATGGQQSFTLRDHSGTGTQSVAVKIPAGTRDGATLRVPGLFPKSPTPDVLVRVRVQAHDLFRRSDESPDSLDVVLDLPLTIAEATLGATVEVPTLHGRVSLTIPAGTASGRKLRLRGMGMTSAASTKGDLVAICQIIPPNAPAISDLEKDVLQRIANLGGNPRVGKAWHG